MGSEIWVLLNSSERILLREALAAYRGGEGVKSKIAALLEKIGKTNLRRCISIHLEGGFVEELKGNPLPVRIYDYDSTEIERQDVDPQGRCCVISEFGPDRRAHGDSN